MTLNTQITCKPQALRLTLTGTADVLDVQPEFAYLDKYTLRIDDTYQRNISTRRVHEIAINWSWIACGALKVALRADGNWYVFDGQHRWSAAMALAYITTLPCLIYESTDVVHEAKGFLTSNVSIKAVHRIDRFKAEVFIKNPIAVAVATLVASTGHVIRAGIKPGESAVSCVGVLEKCVAADNAAINRLWPLLALLTKRDIMSGRLVDALFYIETHAAGDSLLQRRWINRIMLVGAAALKDGIDKAVAFRLTGTPRIYAEGALNVINHGLKRRLEVEGI